VNPNAVNERTIFLGALDLEDPAMRAAFLDSSCAGQPALRQRVEELLRLHEKGSTFLNTPALEQMAAAEDSLAFLGPAREPSALGRLDHYEVLEVVGKGATGIVLKARDTTLQRIVAIKVLAARLAARKTARQRFVREAQAAAAIRDDHVIAIYAVSDTGAAPYLVMEFIHGTTLEQRIKQAGALPLNDVLRIGAQTARGLAAAHAQGVIHCDIKPANILLENSVERVKLTDFGLAQVENNADAPHTALVAGTPLYMSPEQARGEPTDHRTDLFSLGSVLYTLSTGRPPFQGPTVATVLKSVKDDTPPSIRELNPAIPVWLGDLVNKLHVKDAIHRLASAQEVADALSRHLAQLQEPAVVAEVRQEARRKPWLWRKWFVLAFCTAGLLLSLGAWSVYSGLWRHFLPNNSHADEPLPMVSLDLRREDIPPELLKLAGGGDPAKAPPELAAVLGDGRFLFPRVADTSWMRQSPDGKVLAAPLDLEVVLFDAQTGDYLKSFNGPGGRVVRVTFSRDSRLLAVTTWNAGLGGAVRVWDLRNDEVLCTRQLPGPKISGEIVISPDGNCLITEGDERLLVLDTRTGQETQSLEPKPAGISSMCFSPDGRHLAVALWHAKRTQIYDWDGKKLIPVEASLDHGQAVGSVQYSAAGELLASGDTTKFKVWNANTFELIRTIETPAQELAFTPDGRTLFATFSHDKARTKHTFTRWDLLTYKEFPAISFEVAGRPTNVHHALSRDGKVLFVARVHDALFINAIDVATGSERFPRKGHSAAVHALAISADGGTLASAGEDRRIIFWDLTTGRVRHSVQAHADTVGGLSFSRDGKRLASVSVDGSIALWDARTGDEVWRVRSQSRSLSRVQLSPDGQFLAAGTEDGGKLWAVDRGAEVSSLREHSGVVRCVAFSPKGSLLAAGGDSNSVLVQELVGGGTQEFTTHNAVNEVAFSPDGKTLAAVTDGPDAAVRLWNLETKQETTLLGHTGAIHGLAFSPTACVLATGSDDGTVRFWDLSAGEPRTRTIGPGSFGGPVRSVAFTPDGRYLATGNANGTVYLLKVENSGNAD
jgi:WD40 repeat protein/tRNA A-37 threonylcarbamoyl transferase component Bud32